MFTLLYIYIYIYTHTHTTVYTHIYWDKEKKHITIKEKTHTHTHSHTDEQYSEILAGTWSKFSLFLSLGPHRQLWWAWNRVAKSPFTTGDIFRPLWRLAIQMGPAKLACVKMCDPLPPTWPYINTWSGAWGLRWRPSLRWWPPLGRATSWLPWI